MKKVHLYWVIAVAALSLVGAVAFACFFLPRDTEEVVFRDPRDRTMFRLDMLKHRIEALRGAAPFPTSIRQATQGLSAEGRAGLSRDAWGRPFRLSRNGTAFEITSAGPDGVWKTPDDLEVAGKAF